MKILIITGLYPPYFVGGYEIKCKLHADELSRRGHEVSILSGNWKADKDVFENGIHRLLQSKRNSQPVNLRKGWFDTCELLQRIDQLKWAFSCRRNYKITRDAIAAIKPDVVYVWQLTEVSLSPVLAVQDQGIPTVFRLDDYWLSNLRKDLCLDSNLLKRKFRAWIIGLQDFNHIDFSHMFVVSHSVKMSYVNVGFSMQNITVIPEGVPSAMVLNVNNLPDPMIKDQFRLLYVGRLVPEKGAHIAIKALAHLVGEMGISNISLEVIGSGPSAYMEQLRSLTLELGLTNHVEFVGFMEHQQVLASFSTYDAVLIPSLWEEPLSGTIAEAMARGLPVIATDRGGTAEIISDCENGLLVPPGDPVKLAQGVKSLMTNPAMIQKFRLKGLNTVRQRFMHERIIDQVEEYFRGILALGSSAFLILELVFMLSEKDKRNHYEDFVDCGSHSIPSR